VAEPASSAGELKHGCASRHPSDRDAHASLHISAKRPRNYSDRANDLSANRATDCGHLTSF